LNEQFENMTFGFENWGFSYWYELCKSKQGNFVYFRFNIELLILNI